MKTEAIIFCSVALVIQSVVSISLLQTNERKLKSMKKEIAIANLSVIRLSNMEPKHYKHIFKYIAPIAFEDFDKKTSPEGYRELSDPYTGGTRSSDHKGLDLIGTWHCLIRPIALNGEVIDKWYVEPGHSIHGGYVRILHPDGWISTYSHLSKIYVKEGDKLIDGIFYRRGKQLPSEGSIGRQGDTGQSAGEHLHLGILNAEGDFVDPLHYMEVE